MIEVYITFRGKCRYRTRLIDFANLKGDPFVDHPFCIYCITHTNNRRIKLQCSYFPVLLLSNAVEESITPTTTLSNDTSKASHIWHIVLIVKFDFPASIRLKLDLSILHLYATSCTVNPLFTLIVLIF